MSGGADPSEDDAGRLAKQLEFIAEAGRLKGVLRQTRLAHPARRENSAEHSWHLAFMAVTLAEYAPPGTDIGTVIDMVVLHDLVEVDAGDLSVHADDSAQEHQRAAEIAAADRLFGLLPAEQAAALRALWDEFEERKTAEARFARALDRLQPILEDVKAGGASWRAQKVTADRVLEKVKLIEDGSAALGRYARRTVEQAVLDGILAPAPANPSPEDFADGPVTRASDAR